MNVDDFAGVAEFNWYDLALKAGTHIELILGDSNIRPRVGHIPNLGDKVEGHAHNFDHVTFCAKGKIGIAATVNGQLVKTIVTAGSGLLIKADVEHTLVGLEADCMYVCLYSHRTPQGEIVQKYTGWPDAYC